MTKKRFRGRASRARPLLNRLESARATVVKRSVKHKTQKQKRQQIILSEEDKITYIYEMDDQRNYTNVVDVSYEYLFQGEWKTVLRYDSEHGYLHRHRIISLIDKTEVETRIGVIKRGGPHEWLTWAIKDIMRTYREDKKGVLRKSKLADKTRK